MPDNDFLFLPDIHLGYTTELENGKFVSKKSFDEKFLSKIWKFAKTLNNPRIIFGGDQFEFASISRYNKDSKAAAVYGTLEKDLVSIATIPEEFLYNSIWMIGNHDDRINDFVHKYPQVINLVDPIQELQLKTKYKIQVIPRGGLYNIGKLWFVHGDNIPSSQDIAKTAAYTYLRNIRFGHYHTYRSYTLHSAVDNKDYKTSVAVPACTYRNASYMKNKPNKCLQGFLYGHVSSKGNFSDYVVVNTPEGFVVNGTRY